MTYKTILSMCVLFLLVPAWFGIFWIKILNIRQSAQAVLTAWVLGITEMLALGQLALVPLVAGKFTLTTAVMVIKVLFTLAALLSFYTVLRVWGQRFDRGDVSVFSKTTVGKRQTTPGDKDAKKIGTIFFLLLAVALILLQAWILARYQHIDDDDARFVSEEVSAVVHDTMLVDDPIEDAFMYWDVGETRKELASPWTMYVAACCRIVDTAPAIFSHTLFPFFMILICYGVYALIGQTLFAGDWEKTALFLIFLSALHIWDYTSTHTLGSMLLLRIWQGKASVASFIVPLLFFLFFQILRQRETGRYPVVLYMVSFAGSLLSGIGIVIMPVLTAIYGIVDFCCHRNWKKTLLIWCSAAPCGLYLVYYLMGLA